MQKWARTSTTVASIAVNAWAIVGWVSSKGWAGKLTLGAPEYAALIVIGTGAFLAVNWYWIDARRPSKRFHAMHDQLAALHGGISRGYRNGEYCWIDIRKVTERLDSLSVKYPKLEWPVTGPIEKNWRGFLTWLIVFSDTSNIKAACKVAKEHNFI